MPPETASDDDPGVTGMSPKPATAPFADILCGVDGSRASVEAARQAIALAAPDAALSFIAVSVPEGVHPERHRELTHQVAAIEEATGVKPALADAPRHVPERIIEVARGQGSSLIMIGPRG